MTNIISFDVTCKECGSKNVDLWGHCGQNEGFGSLECNDCNVEDVANDNGEVT